MKLFSMMQLNEAVEHAKQGGQALHIHTIVFNHSPACFRNAVARGEYIAHLFDLDRDRLIKTARRLGVRVVYVDRDGEEGQHIDLCGKPLQRAMKVVES